MDNGGVGKKRKYNSTYKRLQHQAQHLLLLVEQEQRGIQQAHDAQLLLAEVILQHRVLFKLLRPLQGSQALQQQDPNGSLLAAEGWVQLGQLHQLAQTSSPVLRRALEATPEQIRALAAMTQEQMEQVLKGYANKMLLSLELLLPVRYPESLISSKPFTETSTSSSGSSLSPELEQAAQELLARLLEYRQLIQEISQGMLLMMLHAGQTLVVIATKNYMTGQATPPPSSHYAQAVQRLRLTSRQVQAFQLMLKQYNRITQQQAQAGQELVGLSGNSFSLSVAASYQEGGSGAAGSTQQRGSSSGGESVAGASGRSQANTGMDAASAATADDAQSSTASLEELLELHLLDRGEFMGFMSTWAMNTLSPWQCGEYLIACYPFFAYTPALVELSAFIKPCDEPRGYINTGCCAAAAQAAAVAAEIGYLDTHPYMQQRCEALEAQLQWALLQARHAD